MVRLHLLAVHADDHTLVLADGLGARALDGREPRPLTLGAPLHDAPTGAALPLAQAGWGLITPAGERGKRIREALHPLVRHRARQLGRIPPTVTAPRRLRAADVGGWLATAFPSAEERPGYLLIAGSPAEVPLALTDALRITGAVGRLSFEHLADFAAYADKVVRREDAPSIEPRGRALVHAVHDRSAPTRAGFMELIKPSLALLARPGGGERFPAAPALEIGGRQGCTLVEAIEPTLHEHPSVLITWSNGELPPLGGWGRPARDRQGAVSLGWGGQITAADLGERGFLPGGIWVMTGSFATGTPRSSRYASWLKQAGQTQLLATLARALPGPGNRPFLAALPTAALAHPQGPLAVIGPADLAWTWPFDDTPLGRNLHRRARFAAMLRALLEGQPVGAAMQERGRWIEEAERTRAQLSPAEQGALWMLYQEHAATLILGDPAAHLCLRPPAPRALPAEPTEVAAFFGASRSPEPGPGADPGALDRIEEAVIQVLAGELGVRAVAREHALDHRELERAVTAYRQAGREALMNMTS